MKIVITARDFSSRDNTPVKMLQDAGLTVVNYSDRGVGPGTKDEVVAELFGDADIIITGNEPLSRSTIQKCKNLKMLSRRSIGYDSVDLEACREAGITVTRLTGMVEGAVAEQVMAYILYFARNIEEQNKQMHQGEWLRKMTFGAKNRTLGLVGFGGIGKEIARRAEPFGMKIFYNCRHPDSAWENQYGVHYRPLDQLLRESDYVSVNVPLTDETKNMFTEKEFNLMKKDAFFINIARSQVVVTEDLKKVLDNGRIQGAAVDVFDTEPCTDSILRNCKNCILTPHTSPYTSENFLAMNLKAAQNVLDYISGNIEEKYRLV